MALQLYNAMTLRFYGTLGLYGSTALQLCDNNLNFTALWLYSSVITTFMALQLHNSTTLWLYASYSYMSL